MKKIKITINGKEIITTPEKTILEVVNENNLDTIPTLCHDKRLNPFGSCFLCVVEIEGLGKLVPSCATAVSDGMVINTNNDRISASRKTALELLMSNHYADCIGPCEDNCPSHVEAQNYIALISMGKNIEAVEVVKKNNPMPLSIGRVCVRDCEAACRREIVDETVGINYLKRYAADIDAHSMWKPEIKAKKNKKIAIIGGGPAGLTCAYYLVIEGYSVTIFEKLPELGGMLKYGIPEYRLPKKILNDEIKWITDLGVDVKLNAEMGKDYTTNSLLKDGFDSVFIGVGAHKASSMRLENEDKIEGIYRGIDFLREMQMGKLPKLKGTAVIVGGGNTAIDAARNAFRWGAEKVKMVYRRSIKEMPAHPEEIHAAQEEGVEILFLTNPSAIKSINNKLTGIECLKMELKKDESGGRPRPVPMEGSEFIVDCDYLIGAIGQQVDSSFSDKEKDLKLTKWNTINVNEDTYETSIEKVFAGGDVVSGPWTAIGAIAQGKEAAWAIDGYLKTGKAKKRDVPFNSFKHVFKDVKKEELFFAKDIPKERMPELSPLIRKFNFDEVELGFSESQACNEAARCIECGCSEFDECNLRIYANEYDVNVKNFLGEVNEYKPDFSHPYIALDPNKCIECGRCVRTCKEKMDIAALGFVNRGLSSIVKPALELPLLETTCVSCGNCIDTCPTGAISENFAFKNLGKSKKHNEDSICNFCSIGCKTNVKLIDNDTYFVANSSEDIENSINDGYLCVKGRFGHRFFMETDRIKTPVIRENGKIKETDLEDALNQTVNGLKDIIKKHGPASVAVFASPKLSNEELYLAQKLARVGIETNNISSLSNLNNSENYLDEQLGYTRSTMSLDNMKNADVIINISSSSNEENLILEYKIRKLQAEGVKYIKVGDYNKRADVNFHLGNDKFIFLLNGLLNKISNSKKSEIDGFENLRKELVNYPENELSKLSGYDQKTIKEFIELLSKNDKGVAFIIDKDEFLFKKEMMNSVVNYLLLSGKIEDEKSGIILGSKFSNSSGMKEMGVSPEYLPGFVKSFEEEEIKSISYEWSKSIETVFKDVNIKDDLKSGKIKGAIVLGEDPFGTKEYKEIFEKMDFVAVSDISNTKTTDAASIVIPATTFYEHCGSYTSMDGRVQKTKSILKTELLENWKLISKLLNKFDNTQKEYPAIIDVEAEINEINRLYNPENNKKCFTKTGKPSFVINKISTEDTKIKKDKDLSDLFISERYIKEVVKKVSK